MTTTQIPIYITPINTPFPPPNSLSTTNTMSMVGRNYLLFPPIMESFVETRHPPHPMYKLSKIIEDSFENGFPLYHLTKYTSFVIDDVQLDVWIIADPTNDTYYYRFISKNIENDELNSEEFILLERRDFTDILSVLDDIKEVESTHKFMDFYLLNTVDRTSSINKPFILFSIITELIKFILIQQNKLI